MITENRNTGLNMRRVRLEVSAVDAKSFSVIENENLVYRSTGNQQLVKISIVSPDPMIRTFLHGILAFQGYQCEVNMGLHEFLSEMVPSPGKIVFLDGAYVTGIESDAVRHQVQKLVEASVEFVVLTEQRLDTDLTRVLNPRRFQIVWKPLDYRQIGQAMAQIGFGIGEV